MQQSCISETSSGCRIHNRSLYTLTIIRITHSVSKIDSNWIGYCYAVAFVVDELRNQLILVESVERKTVFSNKLISSNETVREAFALLNDPWKQSMSLLIGFCEQHYTEVLICPRRTWESKTIVTQFFAVVIAVDRYAPLVFRTNITQFMLQLLHLPSERAQKLNVTEVLN